MAYSKEEKLKILEFAKEHGINAAANHYHVSMPSIVAWNNKYHIYPHKSRRTFSEEEKEEILDYARRYSITKASRKYRVAMSSISSWNEQTQVIPANRVVMPTDGRTRFSIKIKYEILKFARDYGIAEASYKYQINPALIYRWNTIYKMCVIRKYRKNTNITRQDVIKHANQFSISDAAVKFGLTTKIIKKWMSAEKEQSRE